MTRLNQNDLAPVAALLDMQGEMVELDEPVWANGPTVLTFLRHFG